MFRSLATLILVLLILPAFAEAQTRVRRNVEIEWESIEGATMYEVQVIRKDGDKKPARFKTKTPAWSATIKPGLYSMQIRSFDDRGVPGDWSPPSDLLVRLPSVIALEPANGKVVQANNAKSEDINFKWEPVPGASKYKVKAQAVGGDWTYEKTTDGTNLEVSVPSGTEIQWSVLAVSPKGEDGDTWNSPQGFEMKGPALESPMIERPMSPYIKEVKWKAPEKATKYSYDLKYFNPAKKKWEIVDSKRGYDKNSVEMDIKRPSGKYRLQVQASADRRKNSKVQSLDFEMRGGFRDPAALEKAILRESISKPSNFYAIASYFITNMNYKAQNYDDSSSPSFSAIGGTGRVGAGYQDTESKWGGFGIIDMSGFTIGGQNFTFNSMELHLTRKLEFGQGGLLLFGTGLYSKELPVVAGTSLGGYSGTGKVRNVGPHAGFTYWTPLSDRYGLQANARIYYSMMGSAENGQKTMSSMSYQFGVLGSRRINRSWMGYAGYAYRKDEALYNVDFQNAQGFPQPGDVNSVSIDGHYLNLILEYSF